MKLTRSLRSLTVRAALSLGVVLLGYVLLHERFATIDAGLARWALDLLGFDIVSVDPTAISVRDGETFDVYAVVTGSCSSAAGVLGMTAVSAVLLPGALWRRLVGGVIASVVFVVLNIARICSILLVGSWTSGDGRAAVGVTLLSIAAILAVVVLWPHRHLLTRIGALFGGGLLAVLGLEIQLSEGYLPTMTSYHALAGPVLTFGSLAAGMVILWRLVGGPEPAAAGRPAPRFEAPVFVPAEVAGPAAPCVEEAPVEVPAPVPTAPAPTAAVPVAAEAVAAPVAPRKRARRVLGDGNDWSRAWDGARSPNRVVALDALRRRHGDLERSIELLRPKALELFPRGRDGRERTATEAERLLRRLVREVRQEFLVATGQIDAPPTPPAPVEKAVARPAAVVVDGVDWSAEWDAGETASRRLIARALRRHRGDVDRVVTALAGRALELYPLGRDGRSRTAEEAQQLLRRNVRKLRAEFLAATAQPEPRGRPAPAPRAAAPAAAPEKPKATKRAAKAKAASPSARRSRRPAATAARPAARAAAARAREAAPKDTKRRSRIAR